MRTIPSSAFKFFLILEKKLRLITMCRGGTNSSAFKFKHMRYLDFSYSDLEAINAADSIHQLYNLQTLNLHRSKNVRMIVNEDIGSLINLRHLNLSFSDVNLLPISIAHLQNLSSLDISHNSAIPELPDSISLLYNLTMLKLNSCSSLKALPGNFGALTQLRSLDLFYTRITELPESLTSNICKLEYVNLGSWCNYPKEIKNWVELRHLENHGKSKNSSMPGGIENLTRLEVLDPYIFRKEDYVSIDGCSFNSVTSFIRELADINSLRRLVIVNLENVRGGKIEAERAKLKDKKNIQMLELRWNYKEEEDEKYMRLEFEEEVEEEEEVRGR
ncbi:disease resistance protein TAO1-like isoform X1 [Papaver somniferum]|uniref:disease resistance protein TAO1-like isoform X1 n=1 Tax=Papaver somniferum TaxID=3469 RepID=UPI000E70286F|nr:disease resistance protein TAO1-like isoform X1 [Papaver somniferum]